MKIELEVELKVINDNYEKFEEKIIREDVRYRVFTKTDQPEALEAKNKLQTAREEKDKYEKEMFQRSDEIKKLLSIVNSEISVKKPREPPNGLFSYAQCENTLPLVEWVRQKGGEE